MAHAGDRFAMPDGSVYLLRRPAALSDGAVVEMEFVLPAACVPPPPHVHRSQEEAYEVLEGSLDVMIDGRWRTLGVGESAVVPIGALHTFRNRSGAVVRVLNQHRPALRFEDFIESTWQTLRAVGITRPRDPRIALHLSRVMLDHEETLAPGRLRERIPMQLLAWVARRLAVSPAAAPRTPSSSPGTTPAP
jgi:mannose-6-phosphate isomerase-like protein (cupin superfamily)